MILPGNRTGCAPSIFLSSFHSFPGILQSSEISKREDGRADSDVGTAFDQSLRFGSFRSISATSRLSMKKPSFLNMRMEGALLGWIIAWATPAP